MITIDEFKRCELRIGTVREAEAIPKSSKLLELTVDVGGETRTLVAGIAREYDAQQLVGRQVVVLVNLQPATLMGVESQGMVLAAVTEDDRAVLLGPDSPVPNGSEVS